MLATAVGATARGCTGRVSRARGPLPPTNRQENTAELRIYAPLRQILAALLGVHRALELESRALDLLSPETILRLDAVLAAILDGTMTEDELRVALRRAVIRPTS